MDLKEEVQKLLNEDPNLDEDQADMPEAAACLLAAAAVVKNTKAKARERRVRRKRKRKGVWMSEWLLKRHKYVMYEQLMKHLREEDVKSFRNFVRMDPEMFNQWWET